MDHPRLHLLGGFELRGANGAVAIAGRKPMALLAYLASAPGRSHPREKLASLLWEDCSDAQARGSLRQALSALRRMLPPECLDALQTTATSVTLHADRLPTDIEEFERHLADGGHDALMRAASVYRGDLLDGFSATAPAFEDWAMAERQRLRERALEAFGKLLALEEAAGNGEAAIRIALRILALDPLQEAAHRALMRLYARQGRHGAALRQFYQCRDILSRELGVAPEPETEALFRRLRGQRRMPRIESGPAAGPAPPPPEEEDAPEDEREDTAEDTGPAPHPELRHVAVVAVGLARAAGFDGGDPEPGYERLRITGDRVRELAERHGGTVYQAVGTVMTAVFGAPRAHGNDAARAVRAALAITAEASMTVPPAPVRVGVACGTLLVGPPQDGGVFALVGSALDDALQLATVAAPGEALVDRNIFDALGDRLIAEPAERPVRAWDGSHVEHAWRLRAWRETPPDNGRLPFVGRQAELAQLIAALNSCQETGCGRVVLVRGEPGIGKTRLLEELHRQAADAGFLTVTALVLDFGVRQGQDATAMLTRALVLPSGERTDAEYAKAAARLTAEARVPANRLAALHDLLGLPVPTERRATYNAMDSAARQRARDEALTALLRCRAAERPLLVGIEDIHWADQRTLHSIATAAMVAAEAPVLLVATTRPTGGAWAGEWQTVSGSAPTVVLDLWPLRPAEAAQLAEQLGGSRSAPELQACIERAGGNPLFLEQLFRRRPDADQDAIPGTVQALVLARLDALAPADRAAVQAASVLGQRFGPAVLRHLLDDPGYGAEPLIEHALLRRRGEEYLFAHALVRDAVYRSLTRARRRALHQRAAEWYAERDPVLNAEHLEQAEAPEAAEALYRAAEGEAGAHHHDRALRLVDRGLARAQERSTRVALLLLRGAILHALGDVPASIDAFRQAEAAAGTAAERCRALLGWANGLRVADRLDTALALLDRAEAIAVQEDLGAERASLHHLRGNLLFPKGDIEGCRREHARALDLARQVGSADLEASALGGVGDALYASGRMASADRTFAECLALAEEQGLPHVRAAYLYMRAMTRMYLADLPAAIATARAGIDAATSIGTQRAELVALTVLGHSLRDVGHSAEARDTADRVMRMARRIGSPRFEASGCLACGLIDAAENRREEAAAHLDRALALSRESAWDFVGPWIMAVLAFTLSDPAARRAALAEGERALAAGTLGHNVLEFGRWAIETALDLGDWDAAERHADALEAFCRPEPLPWAELFIARGRALARHSRRRTPETESEIRRVHAECRRLGFRTPLPRLEAALAA